MELSGELQTAMELARGAGSIVMSLYSGEIEVERKVGADNFIEPVTVADRNASRLIVDGLEKAFPDDGILSEEEVDSADDRLAKKRVWMIDPIDGTIGFINRDGDFAVQIGLADDGRPVLGVVFLPFHDEMYFAVRNGGAFVASGGSEPARLGVTVNSDFQTVRLASSRSHRSEKMNRVVEELGMLSEVRRGSVGLKIGLIAKRTCDLYVHLSSRTKFWDTCAPQVIIEEAGGRITDLFGEPLGYDGRDVRNHNGIVASNGLVHDETVDRLRPLLDEFGRLRVVRGSAA